MQEKRVRFHFNEKVTDIRKENDTFIVDCDRKSYSADKVVVATGGLSYSSTGSTGDGYRFAEKFGHSVIEPRSALCPIRIKEKITKPMWKLTLKNISLTARNESFRKTLFGDMEFLPDAISGPVVLSMSSLINREDPVSLTLDLKPALDEEKLDKRLLREIEKEPKKDVAYLISTLLPREFCDFFIENAKIDAKSLLSSLSKEARRDIVKKLKAFPLTFVSLEDIDKGIVTSGGVAVSQIDPRTMESKLCEGLYFIGEVLDVDAFTGGFNLQSALSTGYACARAIKG